MKPKRLKGEPAELFQLEVEAVRLRSEVEALKRQREVEVLRREVEALKSGASPDPATRDGAAGASQSRRGHGSIYQRGARFWIRYWYKGKPYSESAGKTEAEAKAKFKKRLADVW